MIGKAISKAIGFRLWRQLERLCTPHNSVASPCGWPSMAACSRRVVAGGAHSGADGGGEWGVVEGIVRILSVSLSSAGKDGDAAVPAHVAERLVALVRQIEFVLGR